MLLFGTVGTDIFIDVLPEAPYAAIGVFDMTGGPIRWAHTMAQVDQDRFVQIQVRHPDPDTASATCQSILTALISTGITLSGTAYEMIRPRGSASLLNRDQNNRTIFYGEIQAVIDLG